jgi:hypothetical protein
MSDPGDRSMGSDSARPAAPAASEAVSRHGLQKKILNDETDGRERWQWVSGYPLRAKVEIWLETGFVCVVLVGALTGIYRTWNGDLFAWLGCAHCSRTTFTRYAYFFFSGMLGSVLYGGKFLYHVVARGYWHQDRRLWRFLSPFLSGSLALAVAAAIDSGILGLSFRAGSHAACIALGFFSGYFADKALAKMSEVADVIFGVRDRDVGRNPKKHEIDPHPASSQPPPE